MIANTGLMTLLAAVQSLGLIELAGVSWITVRPSYERSLATFTVALLLPFTDPSLPAEFGAGGLRFWQDQARLLESPLPIWDQNVELQRSRMLGNRAVILSEANQGADADVDDQGSRWQ